MTDTIKKAEAIARDIGVPPQPEIAIKVLEEMNCDCPDLTRISELVKRDVSLSARVLKVANSPFFSRGVVESVSHAVQLLGVRNFYNIVLLCSLEDVVSQDSRLLGGFWRHSRLTAMATNHIARKFVRDLEEHAYLTGLFHDSGVVLMMRKYPNYTELLDCAIDLTTEYPSSEKFLSFTAYEDDSLGTNHAVMGFILARSWKINPTVVNTILQHHQRHLSIHKDIRVKKLSALLHIAEYVAMHIVDPKGNALQQWFSGYSDSMKELGITEGALDAILRDFSEVSL